MIFNVILNIIGIMNDRVVFSLAMTFVLILAIIAIPLELLLMIIGVSVFMSLIMTYLFSKHGILIGEHYDEDRPIWITGY